MRAAAARRKSRAQQRRAGGTGRGVGRHLRNPHVAVTHKRERATVQRRLARVAAAAACCAQRRHINGAACYVECGGPSARVGARRAIVLLARGAWLRLVVGSVVVVGAVTLVLRHQRELMESKMGRRSDARPVFEARAVRCVLGEKRVRKLQTRHLPFAPELLGAEPVVPRVAPAGHTLATILPAARTRGEAQRRAERAR